MCSRGEPLGLRGFFFFNVRVTSWLPARVCGVRQEGVIPCRMVPSVWDEVHGQLHDVTGEVQQARLIVAVQRCANCELPRWTRILNFKMN